MRFAVAIALAAACKDSSPAAPPAPAAANAPAPAAERELQPLPADATALLPRLPGDEIVAPAVSRGVRVLATRCIAAADPAAAAQPYADALVAAGWQHVASHGATITADRAPDHIQILVSGVANGPCTLPGHYRAAVMLTRPST